MNGVTLPLDFLAFFGCGALCVLGGLGSYIWWQAREIQRLTRIASRAILACDEALALNDALRWGATFERLAEREGLTAPRPLTQRATLH